MNERWRGVGRFVAYAAATAVPVIWLGVVLGTIFIEEADETAIHQGGSLAQSLAGAAVEPFLQGPMLSGGLTSTERVAIAATTGNLLSEGAVLQIRLRDNDGRVVFDALHPRAPLPPATVDATVQAAVRSGMIVERTRLGADEVDGMLEGTPAIEAYVALTAPDDRNKVVGVAELYLPYGPIEQARQQLLDRLMFALIVGLVALWLVLAVIAVSATRRVRRHSQRIAFVALHDPLTGLPNRPLYVDRVASALAAGGRTATDVALAVLDLDRFKDVNDTLGHRNGDEFLKIIGDRLKTSLRPGDTVARLGADEFGLVLPGANAAAVEDILRRLQDVVSQEAELSGVVLSAEASIGYAVYPDDGDAADSLLQHAALALFEAKLTGASIVRYHSDIDGFDPNRLGVIAELRRSIIAGDFVLHYQPKIDAATGDIVAFEALVRWMHPVRGLVPPGDFIPIAESTGLIVPLTHWVVDTALAQLAEWSVMQPQLSIAVNISARNLRNDLPGLIANRLAAHGVQPTQLVLEITETSFAADPKRATALLRELSATGVRVSLDDFGQGYTSLGSLGHLAVNELKIDRGFVVAMGCSSEDRAIVASVIQLGHQLGLTVVAEGVETEEQCAALRALGCDTMQGYLFSPPVSAARAIAMFDRTAAKV